MRVLIINQPTGNRGDESAHKALVRNLLKSLNTDDTIQVAFFGEPDTAVAPFYIDDKRVKYSLIDSRFGKCRVPILAFKYNIADILCAVLPAYRKMNSIIRMADYVICAPGGICMGKFMNWDHIFWLSRAKRYNKKLAYFSRSFGPFNKGGKYDCLFEEESIKILKYCKIISIRDKRTMAFADSIGIKYIPSIDAAFLDNTTVPANLSKYSLEEKKYVVFVPNSLTWQPAYKNVNQHVIDEIHIHIVDKLIHNYPNYKIVMMPQLFGQETNSDYQYFLKLRNSNPCYGDSIIVIDENSNSDVQQMIIRNASFVIGGRYHSIVFSINNETPFISLSYEDKMFGLLSILQLDNHQIDMRQLQSQKNAKELLINDFDCLFEKDIDFAISDYTHNAKNIANNSFQLLLDSIE
jgi:colanic acid/amylovoran biosynthesis protein